MSSAEENILLTRLLDLFREDPDRIRSFVQAGTNLLSRLLLRVTNWSCLRVQRKEYICKHFRIFVFQFILREAAKKCDIWESAPHIKDIPAKNMAKFEKKVSRGPDLVV